MLFATGCFAPAPEGASGPQSPSAKSQSNATPGGRPVPPKVGNVAWDFTLSTLEREGIKLSDLRGKKVMLNFWATWCGPCRLEIPAMVKLYEEMRGQDFEILAINLREDRQKVQSFADELNMTFPVLLDQSGKVSQAYYVRGIPTTVFIDEEGIIQIVHVGTLSDKILRDYVKRMME
jgi:peroxiredoxin